MTASIRQLCLVLVAVLTLFLPGASVTTCGAAEVDGGYAVVVSKATLADAAWKKVADTLVKKYGATTIVYETSVADSLDDLKKQFPRYACFVAKPEDAGRDFVAQVHRLTRQLDEDLYTDLFWGILTGYDADAALRIAECSKPLTVRRVASGTRLAMEMVEEGVWYCELRKNHMVRKEPGGEAKVLRGPDDTTKALVDSLNDYKADLFVSSGHATERDWQLGFRYKNGQFRCKDGKLYGLDTEGKEHPVNSPNPKVYMPIGNCLMGHVIDRDAMALAWMNSAGVNQMLGYTVSTGFGYGGWGCLDYFVEQPGRYTFTEAFFANHHALMHRLAMRDPASARRVSPMRTSSMSLAGDRDTVAFYGDPAWQARMAPGKTAWDQTLTEKDGVYTFDIKPNFGEKTFKPINTNGSQRGGRPIIAYLPHRVKDIEIVEGAELKPVVTDNFLLIPNPKTCDPNKKYRLVFKATRME